MNYSNRYAVILRDNSVVFPGVPLELDESQVISVSAKEDEVVLELFGGIDVRVPCNHVRYEGTRRNPPSHYGARDFNVFCVDCQKALECPTTCADTIEDYCENELKLAIYVAEALDEKDDRLDVELEFLFKRMDILETVIMAMSDENEKSRFLGCLDDLRHNEFVVGEADALYQFGCWSRDGTNGVPRDDVAAKDFFEYSAFAGNADAQNCLGARYFEGKGVEQDFDMAFYWYAKAAKQGNAKALFNLGLCFEEGKGCVPDPGSARECYEESYKRGYAPAVGKLDWLSKKVGQQPGKQINWGSVIGGAAAAAVFGVSLLAEHFLTRPSKNSR